MFFLYLFQGALPEPFGAAAHDLGLIFKDNVMGNMEVFKKTAAAGAMDWDEPIEESGTQPLPDTDTTTEPTPEPSYKQIPYIESLGWTPEYKEAYYSAPEKVKRIMEPEAYSKSLRQTRSKKYAPIEMEGTQKRTEKQQAEIDSIFLERFGKTEAEWIAEETVKEQLKVEKGI
jgi:hypothetical protein